MLCSHQESNLDHELRRLVFYPLNYGSNACLAQAAQAACSRLKTHLVRFVRGRGLEPPCPNGRYHLKVVRLPISPPAHAFKRAFHTIADSARFINHPHFIYGGALICYNYEARYGAYGVMVSTRLCESRSMGSNPIRHPNQNLFGQLYPGRDSRPVWGS